MGKKWERFCFEIPQKNWERLEQIMQEAEIKSKKELLDNALSLFEWCFEQARAGRTVVSMNEPEGERHELIMPFMQRVTEKSHLAEGYRERRKEDAQLNKEWESATPK